MTYLQPQTKIKFPRYSLHGDELEIVEEVKYLGVIIQSDIKFTAYIQIKLMTANQQLGIIKKALYWVPTNAKLLAYKTLCLPILSKQQLLGTQAAGKTYQTQNNSMTKQCDL